MANSILLLEDDERDLELFQIAFSLAGAASELCEARSVDQAISSLLRYAEQIPSAPVRLVLLDVRLRGVDGIAALKHIRADARTRGLPVVMFTDSESESDTLRSYEAGANAYVVKPRTLEALVETVRSICEFWLERNVLPSDFNQRNRQLGRA